MPTVPQEVVTSSKHWGITRKVLLAVLLLGLFCLPLIFLLHPAPAVLSMHVLQIQRVQDSFVVSFAISNETHRSFEVMPVRLERLEGNVWKEFRQGVTGFGEHATPPT